VRVRLIPGPDAVEVEIADDGHGFDPARRVEGFGLIGMRERAGLVGGDMRVESSEAGTTVRGSFPLMRETDTPGAAPRHARGGDPGRGRRPSGRRPEPPR
jgi:signal transduction histidine kinase